MIVASLNYPGDRVGLSKYLMFRFLFQTRVDRNTILEKKAFAMHASSSAKPRAGLGLCQVHRRSSSQRVNLRRRGGGLVNRACMKSEISKNLIVRANSKCKLNTANFER